MKTSCGPTSWADHPILNVGNFVLLALVQVFVIVMSTLAAGLTYKIFEGVALPLVTHFLTHFGFLMLFIPLAWIASSAWLRIRSSNPDEILAVAFAVGVILLVFLILFGGYAVIGPFRSALWAIGSE